MNAIVGIITIEIMKAKRITLYLCLPTPSLIVRNPFDYAGRVDDGPLLCERNVHGHIALGQNVHTG